MAGAWVKLTSFVVAASVVVGCSDDGDPNLTTETGTDSVNDATTPADTDTNPGDGDGDPGPGDGDGDPPGDGDGDPNPGDGDGDPNPGDGDGDPNPGDGDGDPNPNCSVGDVFDQATWDAMFLHANEPACSGSIYTFTGLVDAAEAYPSFACEGDLATRRRELAAFLAQISHETTGGWADAPDGPYAWGLCFIEEVGCEDNGCPQYCDPNNQQYPCAPGKTYHGRGAIQLSWNYNYGRAGEALGVDLLSDPDVVKNDSELAIQTALWFWMTEQLPKPSAHDVMVGNWVPSAQDESLGRLPGFGMTTNIINGGIECNMPGNLKVEDRVGFFERYTDLLQTDPGENLYCDMMSPY